MAKPKITAEELRAALGGDLQVLLEEVAEAVNQAEPGRIIAGSEEPVRDASAAFRRALYETALRLRQQREEADFSPSQD
jgi:hypothetical protein